MAAAAPLCSPKRARYRALVYCTNFWYSVRVELLSGTPPGAGGWSGESILDPPMFVTDEMSSRSGDLGMGPLIGTDRVGTWDTHLYFHPASKSPALFPPRAKTKNWWSSSHKTSFLVNAFPVLV